METNKKPAFITIAILAVLAAACVTVYQIKRAGEQAGRQLISNVSQTASSSTAASPADPTTASAGAASSSPSRSGTATSKTVQPKTPSPQNYSQAVTLYQNKRIQFDSECHAVPTSMVFKNPVTIMLDNRSSAPRKITISGQVYPLAGYGYAFATISSKTLPVEISVACDKLYNTSKILLQK